MKSASFKYLSYGALAGWFIGYVASLGANMWYFDSPVQTIVSSIAGAIFCALLYNGLMMVDGYSNRLRYAVTGGLVGYLIACAAGFIYMHGLDLTRLSFQDGLIFDWGLIHCAIIIGIIGFLIGNRADRRIRQF